MSILQFKFRNIIFTGLIAALFSSCVTHRDLVYMREIDQPIQTYDDVDLPDYQLKPQDQLYINITSLDDESTNVFKMAEEGNSFNLTPYSASLLSYQISKEGYLQLPVIGNMNVVGKTTNEVRIMIQDSLEYVLSKPTVTVKLSNRYVTILGEVRSPGHYSYTVEELTIYQALGLAGDITDFGNREEVRITRNENNINKIVTLDLKDPGILTSEYHYIRPNDLLYVKPLRKKFWNMSTFPYSLIIATISTVILVYTATKP
jgi:polysaccharide export outer membrane protein